jgi:hypothetical protein
VTDGQRLLLVEAWYPVEAAAVEGAARRTRFGDYFAGDPELLVRTERALLTTVGAPPEVIEQQTPVALEQFDVERDYRAVMGGIGSTFGEVGAAPMPARWASSAIRAERCTPWSAPS